MKKEHWQTIYRCMSFTLEQFSEIECPCDDPECKVEIARNECLQEIASAHEAVEKECGFPSPHVIVKRVKLGQGAFPAPGTDREQ